jgi:hypothetical protein
MAETKIRIKLTDWQQRMVMDHMPPATRRRRIVIVVIIVIVVVDKRQWLMYKPIDPNDFIKGKWSLYLTTAQIARVKKITGITGDFSALQISPEMIKDGQVQFEYQ